MKKSGLFFLLLIQTWLVLLQAQEGQDYVIGQRFSLTSEILGEEREYILNLPESYEGDDFYIEKAYPILILLDGERLFPLVSGMVRDRSSGSIEQIPEMIIVGVPNTNRNRDLIPSNSTQGPSGDTLNQLSESGGAALFLRFLEEELIPEIEQKYRTSNCKVLVGHSFAGLFAVHALAQQSSFNAYLAIDPSLWWDNEIVNQWWKTALEKSSNLDVNLYLSQSNNPFNPGPTSNRSGQAIHRFHELLDTSHQEQWHYQFDFYEKEDHFSVPLLSIYHGLRFLFEGFQFPLAAISEQSPSDIEEHYATFLNRFDGALLPPGKLLNQIGLFLNHQDAQRDKAIALLSLSKKYYPDSEIPYLSLAQVYETAGERDLAIAHYEAALQRNPANENARAAMQALVESN